MSEEKIQNTKETLLELSNINFRFEPDRTFIRNGANAINQLQQENQQLKEQIDILETNYEIIYDYFSQIGKLLSEETCEGMLTKINNLQNKLKQRDEVIDKAIKRTNEIKNLGFDKIAKNEILDILNKYKGVDD